MTDDKEKSLLQKLAEAIGAEIDDDGSLTRDGKTVFKKGTAIKLDREAPAHVQMVAAMLQMLNDLEEHIDADPGDKMNACLNAMANIFARSVKPGCERDGYLQIVRDVDAGLKNMVERAELIDKEHPAMRKQIDEMIAVCEATGVPNEEKLKVLDELKVLKHKREELIFRKEGDADVYTSSGRPIRESDEIDLDWDDKVTHKTVGHA